MKLWLDQNIELNLSREAVAQVEGALRHWLHEGPPVRAELENAANIIRAHLQHVREPIIDPLME